jgi:hypothetical protein
MFNKVIYGYWPLIRIACLANVWRADVSITKVSFQIFDRDVKVGR